MTDAQRGHPVLAELFRHNLWANMTLIDLCATLPDDVLGTTASGTYGGIRETLTHLVGAEERYLSAVGGGPERRNPALEQTAPDLATLHEHARQSGEGFVSYAETVEGNPTLHVTWHGQSYEMPVALFLVQAINHATEHRTQIKTVLTQAGITPPELDGWTWDDARRGVTQ
jgi:uncharacterized damage-inducible protein DinB